MDGISGSAIAIGDAAIPLFIEECLEIQCGYHMMDILPRHATLLYTREAFIYVHVLH